ncbi:MAG: DUF4249 family protein [Balneolales bacterium]
MRRTNTLWAMAILAVTAAGGGCELYEQAPYEEEYFVYSQMTALQPLPRVKLSTTIPFDTEYRREDHVEGGTVHIHLLDEEGDREATYAYTETNAGSYAYPSGEEDIMVLPLRTYELQVSIPSSGEALSSFTTVPDTFRIARTIRETATYMDADHLEYLITKSKYPHRQGRYMLGTRALEGNEDSLTPFYATSSLDERGLLHIRSDIINEASFGRREDDDLLEVRYPWENIVHYGPNEILIHAIDDNMHDFYRTLDNQTGNDHLSPGEMRNIHYNIKGGIGLFGSKATVTTHGHVKR